MELQCDSVIKEKSSDDVILSVSTYYPTYRFPKTFPLASQISATFGSIYLSEKLYSLKKRNRSLAHLSSILEWRQR